MGVVVRVTVVDAVAVYGDDPAFVVKQSSLPFFVSSLKGKCVGMGRNKSQGEASPDSHASGLGTSAVGSPQSLPDVEQGTKASQRSAQRVDGDVIAGSIQSLDMTRLGCQFHETAIVSDSAQIFNQVKIGPFCTVGENVVLEDGVELKSHVTVTGFTRIGTAMYSGVA